MTTVLFLARAAWPYSSVVPGELSFNEGDAIEVTDSSEAWWRGRLVGADLGAECKRFPSIYVERVPEGTSGSSVLPSALAGSEAPARKFRQTLSLHSSERITHVDIPDAERKISIGELHSFYSVHLRTSKREVVCEKRFREIRDAETQLQALFPDRMSLAPSLNAAVRPELYVKKRTSRAMEARRVACEALLQFAVADESMATLLLTFFLGSDSEVIAIPLEAHSTMPAAKSVASVVLHESPWEDAVDGAIPFQLDDMDAFDALLNSGVAVVRGDLVQVGCCISGTHAAPAIVEVPPRDGQVVRMRFASFVWDGVGSSVHRYRNVDLCELTLGDCRDDRLPLGLHAALRELPCPYDGAPVTAVVGPRLAYGDEGAGSAVPPGATLIIVLAVERISGEAQSMHLYARAAPAPLVIAAAGSNSGADTGRRRVMLDAASDDAKPAVDVSAPPLPAHVTGRLPADAAPALPPDTIVTKTGHVMPSVDAAEKAMRAYLASIGQEVPASLTSSPPPPSTGRSGHAGAGFITKLFGGSGAASGSASSSTSSSSQISTTPAQPSADQPTSDVGLLRRLFSGGSSGAHKRPSLGGGGASMIGSEAHTAAASAACAATPPAAATKSGGAGHAAAGKRPGGGHVRSVTEGSGLSSAARVAAAPAGAQGSGGPSGGAVASSSSVTSRPPMHSASKASDSKSGIVSGSSPQQFRTVGPSAPVSSRLPVWPPPKG
jgi:hypothetical protein